MLYYRQPVLLLLVVAFSFAVLQSAADGERTSVPPRGGSSSAEVREHEQRREAERLQRLDEGGTQLENRRTAAMEEFQRVRAARAAVVTQQQRAEESFRAALEEIESSHQLSQETLSPSVAYEPGQRDLFTSHLPGQDTRMMMLSQGTGPQHPLYASPIVMHHPIDNSPRHNLLLFRIDSRSRKILPIGYTGVHPHVQYQNHQNFVEYVRANAQDTWSTLQTSFGDLHIA